jgi:hypothetical protein
MIDDKALQLARSRRISASHSTLSIAPARGATGMKAADQRARPAETGGIGFTIGFAGTPTAGARSPCPPPPLHPRAGCESASVFQAALKAQFATAAFGDGTSALTVTPRRRLYAAPSALSSFSFGGT